MLQKTGKKEKKKFLNILPMLNRKKSIIISLTAPVNKGVEDNLELLNASLPDL